LPRALRRWLSVRCLSRVLPASLAIDQIQIVSPGAEQDEVNGIYQQTLTPRRPWKKKGAPVYTKYERGTADLCGFKLVDTRLRYGDVVDPDSREDWRHGSLKLFMYQMRRNDATVGDIPPEETFIAEHITKRASLIH
jgi:hypothetical protein